MKQTIIWRGYRTLVKPLLFLLHPDTAHTLFIHLGWFTQSFSFWRWLTRILFSYQNKKVLWQTISWIYFPNPVGLSAGFDKDGYMYDLMADVWFGFTQVWSLSTGSYAGNQPPLSHRLLRSNSLIVNYGLKNEWINKILTRMAKYWPWRIPVSFSVVKTNCKETACEEVGIEHYVSCLKSIQESEQGDMYTLNISCPNAFGWEPFTTPERLERLLTEVAQLKLTKPIYIKLPIELIWDELKELLNVILSYNISGVIIGNLKKKREWFIDQKDYEATQHLKWWLSWLATKETCNHLIGKTYQYCGDQLIIVWVWWIFSAEDAYEKIKLWSSLVQLITWMIFQGPQLIGEINKWLVRLAQEDGYSNISEAIGSEHR